MRKLRHRFLAPMVAVSALALGLTACGSGGGAPASGGAASQPAEKIKLTVGLFSDFHYAPLYEEFKKTHPNVEIVERRAQFNDHHTNLITQLTTGAGAADVVAVEGGYIGAFTPVPDKFYNLKDYGLEQAPERVPAWKWQLGVSNDGTSLIGLGTDVGGLAMCYRNDLFEKAGLPTDRDEVVALWPTGTPTSRPARSTTRPRPDGAKFIDGAAQHLQRDHRARPRSAIYDDAGQPRRRQQPRRWQGLRPGRMKMIDAGLSAKLAPSRPSGTPASKGTVRHHRLPGLDDSATSRTSAKDERASGTSPRSPAAAATGAAPTWPCPRRASTPRRPSS